MRLRKSICVVAALAAGLSTLVQANADELHIPHATEQMQRVVMDRIKACMSPAADGDSIVRIAVNKDGTLSGKPIVIKSSTQNAGNMVLRATIRCITVADPLKIPVGDYDKWKVADYDFHLQMTGSENILGQGDRYGDHSPRFRKETARDP
ncbi:hypothetical protein ACMDCR_10420 [Labrys okinawensis]|uniref:hypothetical protein n=1 Tax=Labrys okinawensis TaxID=346911 RepID=UPI0039BCCBC5